MSIHKKIAIGLVMGIALGVVANNALAYSPLFATFLEFIIKYFTGPIGQIFLNMLFMTVIPLVFASIAVGVMQIGKQNKLGRIGTKTFLCFLVLTAIGTSLGILLVQIFKPGVGIDPVLQSELISSYSNTLSTKMETFTSKGGFGIHTFTNIIPRNLFTAMENMDMLAVIFFALIMGIAISKIPEEQSKLLEKILTSIADTMVVIVGFAIKLAPYAVFALIFNLTSKFGFALLEKLSLFVFVVFLGYILFLTLVYMPIIGLIVKQNPLTFFKKILPIMITAFTTSSSNATLPTTIKVSEEEVGIPKDIAGFVLPLGATMNMNGTALFEGVTVLFLAQVFGVPLSIVDQVVVVLLSVLMAVGTAGIPGASIPMIMLILVNFNIPAESIAIILGVDRILDMGRTMLNVTGDVVTAAIITKTEGSWCQSTFGTQHINRTQSQKSAP
ncbi:MAG: dicarboxylate/amino acid:cation symporter [Oligoflexia bacterium]|nr:dicarboxylate/amino acid:cation symporter [Oligoflexia bacterium]MBF0367397.1 dicarboxylate/amino acid:cation symporter [Oligoflexia bacterium]